MLVGFNWWYIVVGIVLLAAFFIGFALHNMGRRMGGELYIVREVSQRSYSSLSMLSATLVTVLAVEETWRGIMYRAMNAPNGRGSASLGIIELIFSALLLFAAVWFLVSLVISLGERLKKKLQILWWLS